jgi:hypothetical protein
MEYNIVVSESETQHINFTSIGRKRVRLVSTNFYVESYQAYEAGLRKNYHGFDPPGCGGRIASTHYIRDPDITGHGWRGDDHSQSKLTLTVLYFWVRFSMHNINRIQAGRGFAVYVQ